MSRKTLIFIFIVLILITLSEIGYYAYLKFNPKYPNTSNLVEKNDESPAISPTPSVRQRLPFLMSSPNDKPLVSKEEFDYVYDEYLPNIAMLKKSENRQIALVQKDFGLAGDVFFDQGWLHIKIVDDENNEVITYRTSEGNIKHLKFYKLVKGIKTPITFSDIKIGDKITYTNYQVVSNPEESYSEYLVE